MRHAYHISNCKNTRKNDKTLSKVVIESIPYDKVSPDKIQQNNDRYKKIDRIEKKIDTFSKLPRNGTRLQI